MRGWRLPSTYWMMAPIVGFAGYDARARFEASPGNGGHRRGVKPLACSSAEWQSLQFSSRMGLTWLV